MNGWLTAIGVVRQRSLGRTMTMTVVVIHAVQPIPFVRLSEEHAWVSCDGGAEGNGS